LAHPPSYYGENLVFDLADFEVNLRFVDGRTDLIVAASAAGVQDGEWLRYQQTAARTFALSIGHEYLVESAQAGATTVTSYYFQFNEAAGKRALQTTVEALELYSQLFGPYPHDTLAVVEADFYDGMEYDGLYFLSRAFYNLHKGEPGDYLVAIAAHETAHQWWYGLIGNDQANEPWLDEALCTYTERLYYEHYYPEAVDWWWQYRIKYYHPSGWVDTSVYNQQGAFQTY
jgi:aminopeptidase N